MKAIRAALFLLGTAVVSCQPDLSRSAGALEIRWLGVSPSADTLRSTVSRGEESYQLETVKMIAANRLSVESVPSGPVTVLGEALSAGLVIQTRLGSGEVPTDGVGIVVLDLGIEGDDGGRKSSVEDHAFVSISAAKTESGGTLTVAAPFVTDLGELLETAAISLERPVNQLTVTRAIVTVTDGDRIEDGLSALWSDSIRIEIVPAGLSAILIASGSIDRAPSASLAPTLATIGEGQGLPSLRAQTAQLRIDGAGASSGSDVSAVLSVDLTFVIE